MRIAQPRGSDGCYVQVVSSEKDYQWYYVSDASRVREGAIIWRLGVTAYACSESQALTSMVRSREGVD